MKLLEDKVVKFDGETNPNYGWAVILAGGAGSGKGYNFRKYVPITGKVFDVDELKSQKLRTWRVVEKPDGDDDDYLFYSDEHGNKKIYNLTSNIEGENYYPYNTSNPVFTSLIHKLVKPIASKVKDYVLNRSTDNKDRLPNLIFDKTMSDIEDYESLLDDLKQWGYKIALVYVMTDVDVAIEQNKTRGAETSTDAKGNLIYGRRVDYGQVLNTHKGMYDALFEFMDRDDLRENVDDIWIILTALDANPLVAKVYDFNDVDDAIVQFIDKNYRRITALSTEYALAKDKSQYNEGINCYEDVEGIDLLEALHSFKELS